MPEHEVQQTGLDLTVKSELWREMCLCAALFVSRRWIQLPALGKKTQGKKAHKQILLCTYSLCPALAVI